jgi:hypothetical protein
VLTLVEVTNASSNTLQLPIADSSAGYVVIEIDGLDPVNAALTSSSMAQVDGAQPQNARRDTRNITMKVGLVPDFVTTTVDSLRSNLYDYFMSKANVSLAFYKDDALYAVCSGQVETCSNNMFSADPEVDISIICYDPDFYGPAPEVLSANTTSNTDTQTISYEGSSDAGIIFTLSMTENVTTGITLYNIRPDNTVQIMSIRGRTFLTPGQIIVNTIPGQKSLQYAIGGVSPSILTWFDPTSDWISLGKGDNQFRAVIDGDPQPYTVSYVAQYGAL